MSSQIEFWNRETKQVEREAIYGEKALRWAYENALGQTTLEFVLKRPWFSKLYGKMMDAGRSRSKIPPFIETYGVNPREWVKSVEEFESFNDFFIRKLKPQARPIDPHASSVILPADGRHLIIPELNQATWIHAKGRKFDLNELCQDQKLADEFRKGSALISRLCPTDYHRFHFPVQGVPGESRRLDGPLYSVSPVALSKQLAYLWRNKRELTLIGLEEGRRIAMMEIGATCVGSILQTYLPGEKVSKGDEKGYFKFGGSCTIVLFPQGMVEFDLDILEQSVLGRETYAKMGEKVATLKS